MRLALRLEVDGVTPDIAWLVVDGATPDVTWLVLEGATPDVAWLVALAVERARSDNSTHHSSRSISLQTQDQLYFLDRTSINISIEHMK